MRAFAQRIDVKAKWEDLVVPQAQVGILREIAAHGERNLAIHGEWGPGIACLFEGARGTGKTMAAEVLAGHLGLDLFRIDLSALMSEYIGETEKNLRTVFEAAEDGGAILLFDEADVLFDKRTEVNDSHDRYANLEMSYLLQRVESYRGLVILATNLKSAIDTTFLRRFRFCVKFPFP